MLNARHPPRRGFTMVELMVTLSIIGILGLLVVPSMHEWVRNARVRSTAETLRNGLKQAQKDADFFKRQVVFTFTNATPGLNAAAVANGSNWSIQTVPKPTDVANGPHPQFIRGGPTADVTSGIIVDTNGENAVCFGSTGRLVPNNAPGPNGAVCNTNTLSLNVRFADNPAAARTLRVRVSVDGRISMCDPDKVFSATKNPDGC